MDLRIKRTRQSIINAFVELRKSKPLEKITVTELANLALINKATFYSHYQDIYDLSEQLEDEIIDNVITKISHPEALIINPKQTGYEMYTSLTQNAEYINAIFSGSRTANLLAKLEEKLKKQIYFVYPEYKNNLEWSILLSILIQGGFYAFLSHSGKYDNDDIIRYIGEINERILFKK